MENKTFKIHKQRIILPDYKELNFTLNHYNKVIHYLLPKIAKEFDLISELKSKDKNNFIEKLFHKTSSNLNPKYNDFNTLFPNFPAYFRRTAIMDCIGIIQSFNSRFNDWLEAKKEFEDKQIKKKEKDNNYQIEYFHHKPPTFNLYPNQFPTFYKGNMFDFDDLNINQNLNNNQDFKPVNNIIGNDNNIKIKVNKTESSYQYINITLKDISSSNFKEQLKNYQFNNPKLIKKGKKFFLYFLYEKKVQYKDKKDTFIFDIHQNNQNNNHDDYINNKINQLGVCINENLKIMGIDLGINNDAVISIISGSGTVLAKKFINFTREKGQLQDLIHQKNQIVSKTGTRKGHKFIKINKKIKRLQIHHQNMIVKEIMLIAKQYNIDYMIMENMDNFYKTKKKSLKENFHYWNKSTIQNKLQYQCLDSGIRYRKINPQGTSQYAYDGSGLVARGKDIKDNRLPNYGKGIYQFILLNSLNHKGNFKIYNADLNASYNIASRFIYNELNKLSDYFKDFNSINNLSFNKSTIKEIRQLQVNILNLFCRYSFTLANVKTANNLLTDFSLAS